MVRMVLVPVTALLPGLNQEADLLEVAVGRPMLTQT